MKAVFENKELEVIGFETNNMNYYEPMFHAHGEILYVSKGKVTAVVDGKRRVLTPGEMCIVFPYAIHSYKPEENAEVVVVLFSYETAGEFGEILLSAMPDNPFFAGGESQLLLAQKILSHSKHEDNIHRKTCRAYLKALLGEILLKLSLKTIQSSDSHTIQAVINYCREHFAEDVGVKDVCANVFVSERYVTKIFAQKVGCSFRKYINRLRLSKAVSLIENTHMKITDIMYECGFKNQSTFNRVFMEEFKMSPGEYRKGDVRN